jgi:hypothetical protein
MPPEVVSSIDQRACLSCGASLEDLPPAFRHCRRTECLRLRKRDFMRTWRAQADNLPQKRAAENRRYKQDKGKTCLDCETLISPNASRCVPCEGRDRRRREYATVPCNGCGLNLWKPSTENAFCRDCYGLYVRAGVLLRVTRERVRQLVQQAQLRAGRTLTRREALFVVLQERGHEPTDLPSPSDGA